MRDFLARWLKKKNEIFDITDTEAIMVFQNGCRDEFLTLDLGKAEVLPGRRMITTGPGATTTSETGSAGASNTAMTRSTPSSEDSARVAKGQKSASGPTKRCRPALI